MKRFIIAPAQRRFRCNKEKDGMEAEDDDGRELQVSMEHTLGERRVPTREQHSQLGTGG